MKELILKLFDYIPFVNRYYSGIATIFMLHRVHPFEKNKLFSNENMKISPEFLEQFILKLKRSNYKFISLNELYNKLQNNEKGRKNIIFTLDDGYKDNYEIAYPIFKKHNIPFTVYITTSFPEKNAILWWYALEDLIIKNDKIILSSGQKYICKTKAQKEFVFLEIRKKILSFEKENFLDNLNSLFENYEIDWYRKVDELAMNWQQIKNMSNDTLCTIAGHTTNHYALNQLSKDEVVNEISEANQLIELKIEKKVNHFCYPFGSKNEIGQREFDIVKNLNFKTATTTRRGNIYHQHKKYLMYLPRIMLTENFKISFTGRIRREKVVTL